MLNILRLLFFAFLFVNCNSTKPLNSSILYYEYKNEELGGNREIVLNTKNRVFSYVDLGPLNTKSEGKYSVKENTIVFDSDSLYRNGYIDVRILDGFSQEGMITINVLFGDFDNAPVKLAVVSNGNEQYLSTNKDGLVAFGKDSFNSTIAVDFLNGPYEWEFESKPKGDIEVILFEDDISKRFFNQEKWEKKKDKIISPNGIIYHIRKGK